MTNGRGRLMAVDLGDRRIGIAISDPTGTIASPAGFVERRAGKRPPLTAILARATELEATGFVVGLPLDAIAPMSHTIARRASRSVVPT